MHIKHYELWIMNYELFLGVPAIAVGLSALSFSATLQKDAAPIPNAPCYYKNSESQNLRNSKSQKLKILKFWGFEALSF